MQSFLRQIPRQTAQFLYVLICFSVIATSIGSTGITHAQVPPTSTPSQQQPAPTNTPAPGSQTATNTPTPDPANKGGTGGGAGTGGSSMLPTPLPHTNIANCDACGYCNGETAPARWTACRKCVYKGIGEATALENKTLIGVPTPDPHFYFTDLGCISTLPGSFASQMTGFLFSIVGGIAFLFFLYGAAVLATSRSDPAKLNYGKRIIYGAIVGLMFALLSIFVIGLISRGLGLSDIK